MKTRTPKLKKDAHKRNKRALLTRTDSGPKQTLGSISINDLTLFTLELPNLNNDGIEGNEVRKSCIPDGIYPVFAHTSLKFGKCFWIKEVPGRSAILIHPGNYYYHTLGCILVGLKQKDMNNDGLIDNQSSKAAMKELLKHEITEIEIITV